MARSPLASFSTSSVVTDETSAHLQGAYIFRSGLMSERNSVAPCSSELMSKARVSPTFLSSVSQAKDAIEREPLVHHQRLRLLWSAEARAVRQGDLRAGRVHRRSSFPFQGVGFHSQRAAVVILLPNGGAFAARCPVNAASCVLFFRPVPGFATTRAGDGDTACSLLQSHFGRL